MADSQASWTILTLLRWTTDYFHSKEVPEPRASAEVLLAHTLGVSRLDLYLRYDQPLTPEELAHFKALVVQRRDGTPVAYLTRHREFWSLDFQVSPAVLIPRPETEVLVAAAVEVARLFGGEGQGRMAPAPSPEPPPPTPYRKDRGAGLQPARWAIEIGVGSGAVVVALAKEVPEMHWLGLDLSAAALAVARDNIQRHGVAERVQLLQGDLLGAFRRKPVFEVLVANLPYVPRKMWESLPRDIKDFEPKEALLGGEDGLDLIRPLVAQAWQYVKPEGWVLLEVGDRQAEKVAALFAETRHYDVAEMIKDFSGIDRVVKVRRRRA